jgi:hypothetical protein
MPNLADLLSRGAAERPDRVAVKRDDSALRAGAAAVTMNKILKREIAPPADHGRRFAPRGTEPLTVTGQPTRT